MEKGKPVLQSNYGSNRVEKILQTLVNEYNVEQKDVAAFEEVFYQHSLHNLDLGNPYRDRGTEALNIEALVSRLFEIAALFTAEVREYFFESFFKEGEVRNYRRMGETDFHIVKMKIESRLKAENTGRVESKYELVVYPPNTHRGKLRPQIEEIKSKGKIPVEVCCPGTEPVFKGLIERFNPTKKDLDVFEHVFFEHTLTDLLGRMQSAKRENREFNLDTVLDEVFAYAKLLSMEIQPFFFDSYTAEIERINDRKQLFLTVHTLKDKLAARRDLQRPAELELAKPFTPEMQGEVKPANLEKGEPPKQKVLALYHIYLQAKGIIPEFARGNKTKTQEIVEIAEQYDVSPKGFELKYNLLNSKEKRLKNARIEHFEDVIKMLSNYPEALKMAKDELRELQDKIS